LACTGQTYTDTFPTSETAVRGTVSGTLADTLVSDDIYETITEELVANVSQLDHRWTFNVPSGGHDAGHPHRSLPDGLGPTRGDPDRVLAGQRRDLDADLLLHCPPVGGRLRFRVRAPPIAGPLRVRVIDANRTTASPALDGVAIDQLWIRTTP
jgi:hypothetical protein